MFKSFFFQDKDIENSKTFSYKCILLFKLCFTLSLFSIVISACFFNNSIQNLIISFGEKIAGRSLNISHWKSVITIRAKCACFLSVIFSIAFYLLTHVGFYSESNYSLTFSIPKGSFTSKRYLLTVLLTIILLSSLRCYWITQKKSYHIDELYELSIINRNEMGFWHGDLFYDSKDFELCTPLSGEDIKSQAFFDNNSLKDCIKDIMHLYINCNDSAHTGFYYILHRLCFLGTKTYNQTEIFWRSFFLNFILFIFSFYFLFLLLTEIKANRLLIILFLLAAFGNPNTIGNTIFFRPFALQELYMILFAYIFTSLWGAIENNKIIATRKNFIKCTLALGFLLVSESFSLFFAGLLGLAIMIKCICAKRQIDIFFFLTVFFSSFIVAKLLYLDFGIGYFDDRGPKDILENLSSSLFTSMTLINRYFINIYLFTILLVLNFFLFFSSKKKRNNIPPVFVIIVILWILICNFFAPFKNELRYTAPAFLYLPFIFVPFIKINKKIARILISILQTILVIFIVYASLPLKSNSKNIPHLDDSPKNITNVQYNKDTSIPVVIEMPISKWRLYPNFNDEQFYYFVNSEKNVSNLKLQSETYWYVKCQDKLFTETLKEKSE